MQSLKMCKELILLTKIPDLVMILDTATIPDLVMILD